MPMTISSILTRVTEICEQNNDPMILTLRNDLESALREELARQNHTYSALKTATAILRSKEVTRETLHYPWIDAEGRQCFTNGFEAFRLKDHLAFDEEPHVTPPLRLETIFPDNLDGWKAVDMPTAKELRAYITLERAKHTGKRKNFAPVWDFGPDAPTVNALYLLDAAILLPNATKAFWLTPVKNIVIRCDDGDAIICPIRTNKQATPPNTDAAVAATMREKEREDRAYQENRERTEAIRKAHDDYEAARNSLIKINQQLEEAMSAANDKDATPDEHSAAYKKVVRLRKKAAKTMLAGYVARCVYDPDYAITPDTLVQIVGYMNNVA